MAQEPINKNLADVESEVARIIRAKKDLKEALEAKLGISIPEQNPLNMYDEYVYAIPAIMDIANTTATPDSVLELRKFYTVGNPVESSVGEIPIMDPPKTWLDLESGKYTWTDKEWVINPETGKKEIVESEVEVIPNEYRIIFYGISGSTHSREGEESGDIKVKAGYYGQDQIINIQRGIDSPVTENTIFDYWESNHPVPDEDEFKSKYARITASHSTEEGYLFDSNKEVEKLILPTDLINQEPFDLIPAADSDTVLDGRLGVTRYGTLYEGSMPNNDDVSDTISDVDDEITIPSGYTTGGTITINEDEKEKIISENIKSGVTLLGVTGSTTIKDVSDTTATSGEVLSSVEFYNSEGEKVSGNILIYPDYYYQFTPANAENTLTLDPGYYPDGTISVAVGHPVDSGSDIPFMPSTEAQTILASDYPYYFDKFILAPAQDIYLDAPQQISTPDQVLKDTYYLAETGIEEGTMKNYSNHSVPEQDMFYIKGVLNRINPETESILNQYLKFNFNSEEHITSLLEGYYKDNVLALWPEDGLVLPENIKYGEKILNVDGTFTGSDTVTPGQAAATADEIRGGYSAWVDGEEVMGQMPNYAPGEETHYYLSDNKDDYYDIPLGYHDGNERVELAQSEKDNIISDNIRSGITIFGVTGNSNVIDTSTIYAPTSSQILIGYTAFANGQYIEGGMSDWSPTLEYPNRNVITINAVVDQYGDIDSYDIPEGYYPSGSKVEINSDELTKLRNTDNIKSGVTILGVTGTFTNDAILNYYSDGQGHLYSDKLLPGNEVYAQGNKIEGNMPVIETPSASELWPEKPYDLQTGPMGYYPYGISIPDGEVKSPKININTLNESYDNRFYISGPKYKVITPAVDLKEGYIKSSTGAQNYTIRGDQSTIFASQLINQDALKRIVNGYEENLTALPSEVASGKRYVDGYGRVLEGTMDKHIGENIMSVSDIQALPENNSMLFYVPETGWYEKYNSTLVIDFSDFIDGYNDDYDYDSERILAKNIREGVTLFGVSGTFGSEEKEINLSTLNFTSGASITIHPELDNAFKEVTIINDAISSDMIAYGETVMGITGTSEGTYGIKLKLNGTSVYYDQFNANIDDYNIRDFTDFTDRVSTQESPEVNVRIEYVLPAKNQSVVQKIYSCVEPDTEPTLLTERTITGSESTKVPLQYTISPIDSNVIIDCNVTEQDVNEGSITKLYTYTATVYKYNAIVDSSLTTLEPDADPDENNYHFFDNFGELKALNDNYTESDLVISKDNPSYELSKGYYSNDFTVGITSNDEENLLAENIRAGVTLLGVEGTYTGQININNEVLLPASTRLTLTYLSNGEVLSGLTMDGGQPLTLRLVKTLGSCPYRNWVIMFNGDKSSAVLVGSIPPSAKTLEYTIPVVPVSINVEAIPEGTTLYFNITNQRQPRLIDGVFEANGMYYPENEENPADGYKSVSVAIPFSSTSVTASDVAPGVTFYNQDGQIDTGTMPTESTDIIFSPGHTTETLDGRYFCDALVYATPYLVDGEEGIVHPTTSQQTINASEAFFTKFTVGPAQDVYLNAMATISSPSDVLAGTYYLAETGIEEGTMPDNGIVSATISTKAGTVNIPAGYTSGGTVSISSTEQAKIIASNIKKDVTILGVTGTLEGSSAVLIQKNINQPGTYNASSDNADGYYSVTVTGPQITQDPITGIVTII